MVQSNYIIEKHRHLTTFDLRVELLFDALLDNLTEDANIVVNAKGLFYRRFSKDRMNVYSNVLDNSITNIDISRDGFYDILPEKISHNDKSSRIKNDFVKDFKTRKREENEARHFFNPIENELFRFRHSIEKYESDFFATLNSVGVADIIKTILVVDDTIPDALIVKMFYALLKQNKSANQSIDSICSILEDMLLEKVTYKIENIKLNQMHDIEDPSSELTLGISSTLQSNQEIFLKKYQFEIGPLRNSENLKNYFLNQTMETFLKTFFNLFLPFHVQFDFAIRLNDSDQFFELSDKNYKGRLGISTRL